MTNAVADVLLGEPPRRPDQNQSADYYTNSYLLMRTSVGVLGILLPAVFIIGEMFFLEGGFLVRGSISAYYHSPMRDVFVAGLCVIGFLLMTYVGGQPRTRDFWYSLVAGLAVLGVVFFPTWRDGVNPGDPLCGTMPSPAGCSPIEQTLGEAETANIHAACAITFILSLALMSFLFARDEIVNKDNRRMQIFHNCCGALILAAGAWVFAGGALGYNLYQFTPLYTGEVVAVWAFAASWLFKGFHVRSLLRRPQLTPALSGPVA